MSKQKNTKQHSKFTNQRATQSAIVQQQRYEHSGPLPTPIDFAKYNEVVPGAGERILSMAESQVKHLQKLQDQTTSSHFTESKRGQYMAFILGILGLSLAAYLGIKGHGFTAFAIAIAGVSSMMSQVIRKREK